MIVALGVIASIFTFTYALYMIKRDFLGKIQFRKVFKTNSRTMVI